MRKIEARKDGSHRHCAALATRRASAYHDAMKPFLASLLLAGACIAFVGCESELPSTEQPGQKLERGLTGQGTVYQPDKSNDPIIREETRVGN